jgi:hypothetical protein
MVIFRKKKLAVQTLCMVTNFILFYFSVLNEFDFNYLTIEYFSFNFPFILIFYFTLKGV